MLSFVCSAHSFPCGRRRPRVHICCRLAVGCVQAVNKKGDAADASFTTCDANLLRLLCDHIAIFVEKVG